MARGRAPDGTWSWQVKWGCRRNWLGSVRGLITLMSSAFARRCLDGHVVRCGRAAWWY